MAELKSRLTPALLERFLSRRGITAADIEAGKPVWTIDGKREALSWEDVDELAAHEDRVAFALLFLTEEREVRDDDGNLAVRRGDPWRLWPVQERLARLEGDWIVTAAAEVGKSRDCIARALHCVHTRPGASVLVAANAESTTTELFSMLLFQCETNPTIAGGLAGKKPQRAPYYELRFRSGSRIQLRICGADGSQFRGGHFDLVLADECAKWRAPSTFSELFRAAMPGATVILYSTPDGSLSSAFAGLVARAASVEEQASDERKPEDTVALADEKAFRRLRIGKPDCPPPFWTPKRAAKLLKMYGGEQSLGWQTNVLGKWGSAAYSLFPMPILRPNLTKELPDYRLVVVDVIREERRARLRVASLDGEEQILASGDVHYAGGEDLAAMIVRWCPDLSGPEWEGARLFVGADLGSNWDPSELLVIRVDDGRIFSDVFRLHLAGCGWEEQSDLFAALDHSLRHVARYAVDRGSAGAALVEALRDREKFTVCPTCRESVYFNERLFGFNFGETVDETSIDTGEIVTNPDRRNAAGEAMPYRLSTKELSTRYLERKIQAAELRIADDGGAGDQALAAASLLENHTVVGLTSRSERKFRGENDHSVDARRLCALAVAQAAREGLLGGWVAANAAIVRGVPRESGREAAFALSDSGASARRLFGAGRLGRLWSDDY